MDLFVLSRCLSLIFFFHSNMKKIIIITIAFFMSISASPQIKYGVKAGLNVSKLSGVDLGDGTGPAAGSDLAYGFHAGVFANYSFSHLLGIQPEVLFSIQGGKYSYINSNAKRGTNSFNYIILPLLLEIKPFKSPFSFLVGPQFGLCISRSFYNGYLATDKDYINFDFAIAFGVQYYLTKHLALGLRYNHGLIQSLKWNYEYEYGGVKYNRTVKGERNLALQLSAGWSF